MNMICIIIYGVPYRICFARTRFVNKGSSPHWFIETESSQAHQDRMILSKFVLHARMESEEATDVELHEELICFRYDNKATIVHVHMATSLISDKQAITNFEAEVSLSKTTFDDLARKAKSIWNV